MTVVSAACGKGPSAPADASSTLRVGFGLSSGANPTAGLRQVVNVLAHEGLFQFSGDGRPQPWLAERLDGSPDGLEWRIRLRPQARFHDGRPVNAETVRQSLVSSLPAMLGPAYNDIASIDATGEFEITVRLKRRSTFAIEGLDVPIAPPDAPGIGTAAFKTALADGARFEMVANDSYYYGRPAIERIVFRQFPSVRAAWAELLRGEVDVLYDVGADALDSLKASSTRVVTFTRPYTSVVLLNNRRAPFNDRTFRRAVSDAIDREQFVRDGLQGLGRVVANPVWPDHWATDPGAPSYRYQPRPLAGGAGRRFTCLYSDPSIERQAILLQRMLRAINVDVSLEYVPLDQAIRRVQAGDFDAWLADAVQGPSLQRAYAMWHSTGVNNLGRYASADVDRALDQIREAANDDAYRAGVRAFQRAIVDDPPAIFLAWSQRARAVNTAFDIPVEPGRDILGSLRSWRHRPAPNDGPRP